MLEGRGTLTPGTTVSQGSMRLLPTEASGLGGGGREAIKNRSNSIGRARLAANNRNNSAEGSREAVNNKSNSAWEEQCLRSQGL